MASWRKSSWNVELLNCSCDNDMIMCSYFLLWKTDGYGIVLILNFTSFIIFLYQSKRNCPNRCVQTLQQIINKLIIDWKVRMSTVPFQHQSQLSNEGNTECNPLYICARILAQHTLFAESHDWCYWRFQTVPARPHFDRTVLHWMSVMGNPEHQGNQVWGNGKY